MALIAALLSCARPHRETRLVHGPPAPFLSVRTARFVLIASAYADLEARRLVARGGKDDTALVALGLCSDEDCARKAMGPAAAPFDAELGPFLASGWERDAARARTAIDASAELLSEAEDVIAPKLGGQLGLSWPDENVPIVVTAAPGARQGEEALDAAALDVSGPCFEGAAIVECAFHRAIEGAKTRSALLAAVDELRPDLTHDVVLFAAGDAVRQLTAAYDPARHFPNARAGHPEVFAWLAREWPKRVRDEVGARAFGLRMAREAK